MKNELATFGGGCFWCTEAIFEQIKGVQSVTSGYSGGDVKNPTYKEVCQGITGHAEVIQIAYDAQEVKFEDLLEVFFSTHDPTTLNRQGADVGTQYRSVVFYHNSDQRDITEAYISQLNSERVWNSPIVTEISAFEVFYPAEDYHQEYFNNNKTQGYCRMVIQPKISKFRKEFKNSDLLK